VRFWTALLDRYIGAAREQLGERAEEIWKAGLQLSFEDTIRLAHGVQLHPGVVAEPADWPQGHY